MDCIFCKIINREIDAKVLYENDYIIIFMDANPDSPGHILVIPKKHITDFTEMDDDTIKEINKGAKLMEKLITEKLNPDGIKLVVNYGTLQVVKHYHLHLIPFYKNGKPKLSINEVYNILKSE